MLDLQSVCQFVSAAIQRPGAISRIQIGRRGRLEDYVCIGHQARGSILAVPAEDAKDMGALLRDVAGMLSPSVDDPASDLKIALDLLEEHLWSAQDAGAEPQCIGCPAYRQTFDGKPSPNPHEPDCAVANFLQKHGRRTAP